MNKAELIAQVANRAGMTRKDAEVAVTSVIDIITEKLKDGEKVQIVGFGTFEVKERAERIGRDPRTNDEINFEASKAPAFKAGKVLKDAVNG